MVSHDMPNDSDAGRLNAVDRQMRALQRLDDGHAALRDALSGLDEAEAFLGSRWSVWEVMQHLLTENFVGALEEIATGQREMLPAFDGRANRIAADVGRLEANYQRFRALIAGLTERQLNTPATPPNPENDFPSLSLLDLIERVSGHEGNHARQVTETRKYVDAFRTAERAITVAGLGTGDPAQVPTQTRELLANADYVVGAEPALALARRWIRGVELRLRDDNWDELVNRLGRDIRAGLWSMVVTLGDPAESAPGLLSGLRNEVNAVSLVSAPGFYRAALAATGVSPLDAVCVSAQRDWADARDVGVSGRATVLLGSDGADSWREIGVAMVQSGLSSNRRIRLVTGLAERPRTTDGTLYEVIATDIGETPAAIDSALVLLPE
jgi:precorrin-6B methylase 1